VLHRPATLIGERHVLGERRREFRAGDVDVGAGRIRTGLLDIRHIERQRKLPGLVRLSQLVVDITPVALTDAACDQTGLVVVRHARISEVGQKAGHVTGGRHICRRWRV
jgi:hypothetical protein